MTRVGARPEPLRYFALRPEDLSDNKMKVSVPEFLEFL